MHVIDAEYLYADTIAVVRTMGSHIVARFHKNIKEERIFISVSAGPSAD